MVGIILTHARQELISFTSPKHTVSLNKSVYLYFLPHNNLWRWEKADHFKGWVTCDKTRQNRARENHILRAFTHNSPDTWNFWKIIIKNPGRNLLFITPRKLEAQGEPTTWTRTPTHWVQHKLVPKPQGWRCATKITCLTSKLQTPVNHCSPASNEHKTAYPLFFFNDQPFPLFSRGYPTSPGVPDCTFICYFWQTKSLRGELSLYFHLVPTVIFLSVKLTFDLHSHILPLILMIHLF